MGRSNLGWVLALMLAGVAAGRTAPRDLVVNGGFEHRLHAFDGHVNAVPVADQSHSGQSCLRVDGDRERNSYAQQEVPVEAGREYDLTVWHRCEGIPEGADCKVYLNLWKGKDLLASTAPLPRIAGSKGWTRQGARIKMPEGADRASILLQLYRSAGTVWFDDLSFLAVERPEERARRQSQDSNQKALIERAVRLSRTTPEVAPGVRFASYEECLFLCNRRMALTFDGREGAFGLKSLVDLALRREFVVPGFDGDLLRVEMKPAGEPAAPARQVLSSTAPPEGCSWRIERSGKQAVLSLRWAVPGPEAGQSVDAEATVSLAAEGLSRWRLRLLSNGERFGLWCVDFPRLPALGASGETREVDYLAIPMEQGRRWRDPRRTVRCGEGWAEYPGGGMTMQFDAYLAGDATGGGLYLGAEDGRCYRKTVDLQARGDAFSYALRHYPEGMGEVTRYELPYPVTLGVFTGDWWDASAIYRSWALRQRWSRAGPTITRRGTPGWFKELPLWLQGDLPGREMKEMERQASRVAQLRRELGPLAFHAYLWQDRAGHDRDYPDFLPAKPGARPFFERLRSEGVRVTPYLNIYSADGRGPAWDRDSLARIAMADPAGNAYAPPTGLVPMCPAAPQWQEAIRRLYGGTLDALPTDGLYLDQLTGHPFLCHSRDHGHPAGGGRHFHEGMRALAQAARDGLRRKCPQGISFGENTSEGYNDLVDAHLTWAELDPEDSLPLYPAVYADFIARMGLFVGRPDLWGDSSGFYSKLAREFTWGEQLGWLMLGILNEIEAPQYAPQRAYVADLAAVRAAALEFLGYGQMLRPLHLEQQLLPVSWDDWSRPRRGLLAPVPNSVWRNPGGGIGVVLANWTADEQELSVPLSPEWRLPAQPTWRICRSGRWGAWSPVAGDHVRLTLPARASAVVAFRAR